VVKLDLGSGPRPMRGFRGVDLHCGKTKADRVDLFRFPWPWADDSVDAINCSHFVEHMPPNHVDGDGVVRFPLVQFMDETYRVLKHGAQVHIVHPNLKSIRAFQDPTHNHFIPASTWLYANREWRQANNLDHPPYPSCHLVGGAALVGIPESLAMRPAEVQEQFFTMYWESAADVEVLLTAVKD
jgi:predicted SAM-dependent methyltransferase